MPNSLVSIPGQPVIFRTEAEAECNCGQVNQCLLVESLQTVYAQLELQPCGTVNVCNNALGDELPVTNPTFDSDLSGWTAGAGWSWSGGAACNDGQDNAISQTVNPVNGVVYLVTFDVTSYTSGTLIVELGGEPVATLTSSGSYSAVVYAAVYAGTDILFVSQTGFIGCIDNVVITEVGTCWDADETDWVTSVDGACHDTGNTTDLENIGTLLTVGLYYHFTFTVSSATAGGVTLKADTAAIGAQTSGNGTFDRWGIADGTAVVFSPSSDFDGCISDLEVIQYNPDYVIHLLTEDGGYVADLTGLSSLYENIVTLEFDFDQLGNADYGCYKICIIDGCYGDLQQVADNIIDNGDFSAGSNYWTSSGATFAAGIVTLDAGTGNYIAQNIKTTADADCMRIQFSYSSEGTGNIIVWVNGIAEHSQTVGVGNVYVDIYYAPAGAEIKISTQGTNMPVDIDNVIVTIPAECRNYDFCSQCIQYRANFECTNLLEAWCDDTAHNFLFDYGSGNIFKLSLRVRSQLLHPTYEQEQDDYIYSTGESFMSFGQNTKYQSLYMSPIPEFKHDVIALMKICDYLQIDGVDYFAKKGDYVPEWNKSTNADLAPSRIEVKKKDQTTFNNNCG